MWTPVAAATAFEKRFERRNMELRVSDITVEYGKKDAHKALDAVSFMVPDGAFASVLGQSGAGKSTILKVIAGILPQSAGEVCFDGVPIDRLSAYKRNIGFLFQDIRLFPHMSVIDNVAYPCKVRGLRKAERYARAEDLLRRVQLDGFGPRAVQSLSGGQAQRVALARALAASPDILLLDEPFSGLDENLRDGMRSLLLRLVREERLTTVMVTHDAHEALRMSDVIVALEDGKVTQAAKPQELYRSPATAAVAACFGDCSTLTGAVVDGVFRVADVAVPIARVGGTFQTGRNGAAEAVVRTVGCSIGVPGGKPPVADAIAVGTARVRCSAFAGARWVARLDVDGQTLSAFLSEACEAGVDAPVSLDPAETFIYPVD